MEMKVKFEFEIDLVNDNVDQARSVMQSIAGALSPVNAALNPTATVTQAEVVSLAEKREEKAAAKPSKKEKVVKDIDTSEVMPAADVEVPAPEAPAEVAEPEGETPENADEIRVQLKAIMQSIFNTRPDKNPELIAVLNNKLNSANISSIPGPLLTTALAEFEAIRDSK